MSTPRTDAFVLPHYQVLCVYMAKAAKDDPKAKALLEIALGELEDRRRTDPFLRHFETFRTLLERTSRRTAVGSSPPPSPSGPPSEPPSGAKPRKRSESRPGPRT